MPHIPRLYLSWKRSTFAVEFFEIATGVGDVFLLLPGISIPETFLYDGAVHLGCPALKKRIAFKHGKRGFSRQTAVFRW